jgi:hypothetical protein
MKRTNILLILLVTVLIVAACGKEEEKVQQTSPPLPISVDLQVPEPAETGQEVELVVMVTQGEEVVTDASEVEFDIINDNSGEKKVVPAELQDELYTAVVTLEQPGSYSVTSHVTARDMHTMPTKVIEVTGEGLEASGPIAEDHGHAHHHGAVIDFADGTATADKNTQLSTTITLNDAPLTEAAVRFEIWKDGSEKHDWVDTKEAGNGQYDTEYTFTESGKYFVQVHVEKDPDIHDHVLKEYIVE